MGWLNPRPLDVSGSQRGLVEAVSDLPVSVSVSVSRVSLLRQAMRRVMKGG